ncbi:MAG: DUF2250 domain-containing protein [Archaeoglobus sp.]|jgi:predicted transcriptional regulator|nr:MAG: DUF2250 domain-containing protein [Archaeoglobus sp.]
MLTIDRIYILLHLRKARVDYAGMISKLTGLPLNRINENLNYLMEMGLVKRDSGSAIKRSRAKFKKAHEVHKHHTYYRLTRRGKLLARKIAEEIDRVIDEIAGDGSYNYVVELSRKGKLTEVPGCLKELGFITESGKKTKFFEAFSYVAGI